MTGVPVLVVVCLKDDSEVFKSRGILSLDGSLVCRVDDVELELDANAMYPRNPKRLMYVDEAGDYRWSRYYVRSIILDQKPVKRPK